jgi:hypothetical protein
MKILRWMLRKWLSVLMISAGLVHGDKIQVSYSIGNTGIPEQLPHP